MCLCLFDLPARLPGYRSAFRRSQAGGSRGRLGEMLPETAQPPSLTVEEPQPQGPDSLPSLPGVTGRLKEEPQAKCVAGAERVRHQGLPRLTLWEERGLGGRFRSHAPSGPRGSPPRSRSLSA